MDKNCILSRDLIDSEDIMLNITLNYLKSNSFSKNIFKNNDYVTFKEKRVKFTLSKLNFDNVELNNCQQSFNEYINDTIKFYLLNVSVLPKNSNEPKNIYEIYFSNDNNKSLTKFNLDKLNSLNSLRKLKTEISKCEYYSIESIIHDSCLTCSSA